MKTAIATLLFLFAALNASASGRIGVTIFLQHNPDTTIRVNDIADDSASSATVHLTENKRVVAAILAFPPFGCLGLHRIYLGTDPWVPVVYVLTLGGCGLIALTDFVEIIASDDQTFESFSHNGKVFMWGK